MTGSNVVDINRDAVAQLTADIKASFEARGEILVNLDSLPVPLAQWRRTARAVGREQGRPVKTHATGNLVYAGLADWPNNPREELAAAKERTAANEAISAAMSSLR